MSDHGATPWLVDTFGKNESWAGIYDANGNTVAFWKRPTIGDLENARRIVAAVNATAPIATEGLEQIEKNGAALLAGLRASLLKAVQ